MSIVKKVFGVGAIIAGVVFLFNTASDIQAGFGLVLIVQGVSML